VSEHEGVLDGAGRPRRRVVDEPSEWAFGYQRGVRRGCRELLGQRRTTTEP
jgi:hypothetical protein